MRRFTPWLVLLAIALTLGITATIGNHPFFATAVALGRVLSGESYERALPRNLSRSLPDRLQRGSTGDSNLDVNIVASMMLAGGRPAFRWEPLERAAGFYHGDGPPIGTDTLALAHYAEYAIRYQDRDAKEYADLLREGMRRDPNNALYHYLLAHYHLQKALEGPGFVSFKDAKGEQPNTPEAARARGLMVVNDGYYDYQVRDRALLHQTMRELANATSLDYTTHANVLLRERLSAHPSSPTMHAHSLQTGVIAAHIFPEFGILRDLSRYHAYYTALLLTEGRRDEAQRLAGVSEWMAWHAAHADPHSLIGPLVSLAISKISRDGRVEIFQQLDQPEEVRASEERYDRLAGGLAAWRDEQRQTREASRHAVQRHGGVYAAMLVDVYGPGPWSTPQALRPGRMVEYVLMERAVVLDLLLLVFMLLVFTGIKRFRLRKYLRDDPHPAYTPPRAVYLRALALGVALPVGLYLLFAVSPLAGRDHGIIQSLAATYQFVSGTPLATWQLGLPATFAAHLTAWLLLGGWILLVPGLIVAGDVWRHHAAQGIITVAAPRRVRFARATSSLMIILWAFSSINLLLGLPILLLSLALYSVETGNIVDCLFFFPIPILLAVIPAIWQGRNPAMARHHAAICRALTPVYAMVVVLLATLFIPLALAERHYVRTDRVTRVVNTPDAVSMSMAEYQLVQQLRATMRKPEPIDRSGNDLPTKGK